jgi:hypothetical protein
MARIIVTTGPIGARGAGALRDETPVLLDEQVESFHLCEEHAARQLIERIAWAVNDAEGVEHAP